MEKKIIITSDEFYSLKVLGREIKKQKKLSIDEEVRLVVRIREGERPALDKLVKSNIRFAIKIAKEYQNQGLLLPDLVNAACIGLIIAAEKFDETRGFKFISFAVRRVRNTILASLGQDARLVRLPMPRIWLFQKYQKALSRFENTHGREPELWELSELLETSEKALKDTLGASKRSVKFEAPVPGTDLFFIDKFVDESVPGPDSGLMAESLRTHIFTGLKDLSEVERKTIILFFGLDGEGERTLWQVTEILSINFTQAKNAKAKGLMKLRQHPIRGALKSYLGN